jgi:RND superfamily putative drug exporter
VGGSEGSPGRHRVRSSAWASYARWVVRLRWVVLAAWAAVVVALVVVVPAPSSESDLRGFAAGNPAVAAELRSFELFGFPLISRVALVQHDPDGLSVYAQAEAVLRAAAVTQGSYDTPLLGALPVPNTFGAFPGSRANGTTVVTYLFSDPRSSFSEQRRIAEEFARQQLVDPDDDFVAVTGSVPARDVQAEVIQRELHTVEVATLAAILLIVGVTFRSVVAPIVTLLAAGTAVVVTLETAGWLAQLLGVTVPADLQPLIVALLLGVVTDYCILFLSGLRHRLAAGSEGRDAALRATTDFGPIVAVAGVTVAAGTAALVVAESALFRGFGPGMALTVLVGLVVSLTLVPALLAVLGRLVFWPFWPDRRRQVSVLDAQEGWLSRLVTDRRSAALTAAGSVLVLGLAAAPLLNLQLGLSFVQSLPEEEGVARAAAAASDGFAPGILSPTEILLEGDDVAADPTALRRFGDALEQQPGVAGVLAPDDLPLPDDVGVLVTPDGDAARYLVVLDSAPLGARAIDDLTRLRAQLPGLLADAGLPEVSTAIGGDTALSAGVVQETSDDLLRISLAALSANLFMLVVFLRALVAPLYLLASSVLALCAALGLTVLVFQTVLGNDGLTFYVPFAAAVLLVSLGSDYNIFAVGHIWQLAGTRPLRRAIATAIPQSTRAITSAGTALAASFGLLALVPLTPFRELGFAMAVGIMIDVLVVRALLVPSLLTLVGPVSGWPSRRLNRATPTSGPPPGPAPPPEPDHAQTQHASG